VTGEHRPHSQHQPLLKHFEIGVVVHLDFVPMPIPDPFSMSLAQGG
jgi:hypothetical protein